MDPGARMILSTETARPTDLVQIESTAREHKKTGSSSTILAVVDHHESNMEENRDSKTDDPAHTSGNDGTTSTQPNRRSKTGKEPVRGSKANPTASPERSPTFHSPSLRDLRRNLSGQFNRGGSGDEEGKTTEWNEAIHKVGESTRKTLKMSKDELQSFMKKGASEDDIRDKLREAYYYDRPPRELSWPKSTRTFTGKPGDDNFDVFLRHYESSSPFVADKYRSAHFTTCLSYAVLQFVTTEFANTKYNNGLGYDTPAMVPYDLMCEKIRETYQPKDAIGSKITSFYAYKQRDGQSVVDFLRERHRMKSVLTSLSIEIDPWTDKTMLMNNMSDALRREVKREPGYFNLPIERIEDLIKSHELASKSTSFLK